MIRGLVIFAAICGAIVAWSWWEIMRIESAVDRATGSTDEDRFRNGGLL